MTHITANTAQLAFGGFNDDGSPTTSTAIVATNTNWSQRRDEFFRVRFAVAETAGGDPKGPTHFVQYSVNGGAFAAVGTTTPVKFGTSAVVADATAVTTERLGVALGAFTNGEYDQDGVVASVAYGANGGTEMEYGLVIDSAQTTAGDTIQLRLSDCNQYDQTPTITAIDILAPLAPTLGPPADGATLDFTTPQTFSWVFSSPEAGDAQEAFAIKRTTTTPQGYAVLSGTPEVANNAESVGFTPDGTILAVTHNSPPYIEVFNTNDWASPATLATLGGSPNKLEFNAAGTLLAVAHVSAPTVAVIDTGSWSQVTINSPLTSNGSDVAFSPDGSMLAVAHSADTGQGNREITVFNTSDWTVISGLPADTSIALAFSPDGSLLAVRTRSAGGLVVLSTSTWTAVSGTPSIASSDIGGSVTFSPDGSLLVAAGSSTGMSAGESTLEVFNTSDWTRVTEVPTFTVSVTDVGFNSDGTLLATSLSVDGTSRPQIYDTSTWTAVSGVPSLGVSIQDVKFSPDDSLLAIAHGTAPHVDVLEAALLTEWWNGASWQTTEILISSATESVTFPADSW